MIAQRPLLVIIVMLIDRIPAPPPPDKRRRGHPRVYPDHLFLKALVIMILRHLHRAHELLAVLNEPTDEMVVLRELLVLGRPLPDAAHLGTPSQGAPRAVAGADWLPGAPPGAIDSAVGRLRPRRGHRQHRVGCPRWRVAQERSRGRRRPPHLD